MQEPNRWIKKRNEKRAKKRAQNQKKMSIVNSKQKNLCRFIKAKENAFKVVYHKTGRKYKNDGFNELKGLQIENRMFLENGSYKLVNRHTFRILKVYNGIPEWATESLIKRYETFHRQLQEEEKTT